MTERIEYRVVDMTHSEGFPEGASGAIVRRDDAVLLRGARRGRLQKRTVVETDWEDED